MLQDNIPGFACVHVHGVVISLVNIIATLIATNSLHGRGRGVDECLKF